MRTETAVRLRLEGKTGWVTISEMGLFKQMVNVLDASGATVQTYEAWVDSGSTYTWLPRAAFDRLGIEAAEEREFILANGQRETRSVAQIRISLGGPAFYTYCAVAEEGEELLLGAVALEEAGLAVDPVNRRLVPAAPDLPFSARYMRRCLKCASVVSPRSASKIGYALTAIECCSVTEDL